ncbi:MAG: DUF4381 domain-containing protein [Proteobacteria bacterium]|nr:DUF4381 domain-containing protein [Pseudomonadota bacterium]
MSAPPLPEVFGNYALENFAEIVPPEGISWLPQTAGWLWLGGAVLGLALYYLWRGLAHWYRNRYRREAVARLQTLAINSDAGEVVADINRVLKITALVAFPRERVARLSGESWVSFLNQQCEQPPFNHELTELLASSTYRRQAIDTQRHQLIQASMMWVQQHGLAAHDGAPHA